MRDKKGRFIKGCRFSPDTEFKKGEHWRPPKPFWNREWLQTEYIEKEKSASEIAEPFNITSGAIVYWLDKHDIQTRNEKEQRKVKKWGASGPANGMWGRFGEESPNYKGGISPERQGFYSSQEWKKVHKIVWKRDDSECQLCGASYNKENIPFHVHHIVSFAVRELRSEESNLVLLCEKCHHWVHSRKNKNEEYIQEI